MVITQFGNPVLWEKSKPLGKTDIAGEKIQTLIKEMKALLLAKEMWQKLTYGGLHARIQNFSAVLAYPHYVIFEMIGAVRRKCN